LRLTQPPKRCFDDGRGLNVSRSAKSCPRRHLTSTSSTNSEALDWARDNAPDGAWVTAEEQTAGRGRAGRGWHSPRGNLYASAILRDPGPSQCWPQLGFVCGLALHDALCAVAPELEDRLKLKWPNDLLIEGHKLSGLLLETHELNSNSDFVVIAGFGVNVVTHPADAPYPVTSLLDLGIDLGADIVWEALCSALAQQRQIYRAHGFEPVREAWNVRAQGIGRLVSVSPPHGKPLQGLFRGIDTDGALLVELPAGQTQAIHTADVLFSGQIRSVA
jgi:BirA family biotin operon repressor/biotin-[acetyl-CoA-carboxylase] ligase